MSPRSAVQVGGIALASSALLLYERKVRNNAERLAAALLETLLFAIDANDPETGMHVRRVASYALILADAAELSEHEIRAVERVAVFHDIGKIHHALFDIIHDPGILTPEERKAIKAHPQRGAEVLSPLAAFYPELAEGVLSHHERWDGSGYPRGIAGARIPLTSRIVSIADVFDVVAHGRHYRGKRSITEAFKVIAEGRGTQFDPALTDLFLQTPLMSRIESAVRKKVSLGKPLLGKRRHPQREHFVPDITFRWRSEAPGRQRQGRSRRGVSE